MKLFVKHENWDGGIWMKLPASEEQAEQVQKKLAGYHPSRMFPFREGVEAPMAGLIRLSIGEIVDNVIYEDENRLIFFMPIEGLKINSKEMKAIGVSCDTDKLLRTLQVEAFQGQSNLYVVHEDGTEVFSAINSERVEEYSLLSSLEGLTFKNDSPEEFRRGLGTDSKEDNLVTVEFEGKDYYINHTPITGENWVPVGMIPVEAVSGRMEQYSYHAFSLMAGVCALIIIGFVILYSDAAKQILRAKGKARKTAESTNEVKTNFFTDVSHDIRTPVNAIIGMTEIAVNHLDDPNKIINCLDQIRRSGKLLVELVNDILDMVKVENGKMEIHTGRTPLAELIENIVVVITPLVREKNQDFQICVWEVHHEYLILDSIRMNQVLMNLISNATKFTPKGGGIRATVKESLSPHPGQAHFTFTVSDTDTGVSREFQNNIFTAFIRKRNSRVDHIEESGLGMAITEMVVANMGGNIRVESEPGMGSIFTVELDFYRAEPEMDSESEGVTISSVECPLVETDPEMCKCVCELMNVLGLVPSIAGSGLEAVELMRMAHGKGEGYQLVILDRGLAVYDACEAIGRPEEPAGERQLTILLVAYDWTGMETKVSEAGVDGFVRRPILKSTLEQIVKQYVLHTEAVRRPECVETPILARKRILLVEDNLINREIVKELMEQTGTTVDAVYNGREGADRYASMEGEYYDLILMDAQVLATNGYEAVRLIRDMNHRDVGSIPISAMTADVFAKDIAMARQAGMDRHLSRPIDAVSLIQEIARVLVQNKGRGTLKMKLGNYLCVSALVLAILTLSSCGEKHNEEVDGFAAPETENNRVIITLYDIQPLPHFEEAVENKFPDIDLVQYLYIGDYIECEFTARIKSGDTCGIMMTKTGRIALLDTTESLTDSSTMSFLANYTENALPQNERGEIYFVPGSLSFNAYTYNRTLSEEHGWKVSESFEEYLALCRQVDDSGVRGCELPLGHASMPMYVFCVRLTMDYMTTAEGQTWCEDFLAGRASSQEPLKDTLDVYSRMMDEGIICMENLSLSSKERLKLLRDRQLVMTTTEINTIKALNEEGTDELVSYPQYGMADNRDWLLSLGHYFGAGKYLEQPENMAKREAVMDILEFISTDEGQNLLIEDNIGMVSIVKDAIIPADKVFDRVRRAVMQGNYVVRPILGSLIPVLQPELTSYVGGDISKKEIVQHCREAMEEEIKEEVSTGIAAENLDTLGTVQLKADTMRGVLGADVTLMGVSEAGDFDPVQGVLSKLYAGIIGEQDVKRIAQGNDTVPIYCWTAQVKGGKLLEILDYGAYSEKEREAEETEHFHPYVVASMKICYERNARIGAWIAEAVTVDESAVEPDKSYSVAYLEGVLKPGQVSEPKRTGRLLTEVLTEEIRAEGCVKPNNVSIYYAFDIEE